MEPPWAGGTKVCLQHLGHMTKMAAIPIYGEKKKNIKKSSSLESKGQWPQGFSNDFSETTGSVKTKFHMEPPWTGGTKVCLPHLGHMTKMAATPIYEKKKKKEINIKTPLL